MDEPTDRALKLQGLSRSEYDSMSEGGKFVISSRSRRLMEIADISLAAELLNVIAESDNTAKTYIAEALEGKHPVFADNLRQMLDEYLEADVDTGIKDYYKIKYTGRKGLLESSKEMEAPPKDAISRPEGPVDKKVQIEQTVSADETPKRAQPPADAAQDPLIRSRAIAVILSRWEKREVERVMKSEADIIDTIMKITDQYASEGVTDEKICKASEAMIRNGTKGMQFFAEALSPDNRDILIQTAKAFT